MSCHYLPASGFDAVMSCHRLPVSGFKAVTSCSNLPVSGPWVLTTEHEARARGCERLERGCP